MSAAWKVLGTMCSDNEEKVDGLSVIQTTDGQFVAFADQQYKHLIATTPQLMEALEHLREALQLNEADMKPGIYHYLTDIIASVLPCENEAESDESVSNSLAEEYERVRYNVYAFGADAKRYERKAAAARKDHTRQAWQKKADDQRYYQCKNQQRLVILDAMMQEATTANATRGASDVSPSTPPAV